MTLEKSAKSLTKSTNLLGLRRRSGVPVCGAIDLDNPTSLPSKRGQHIIHISASRKGEVTILAESRQYSTSNGSAMALTKLRPLFFLLSLSLCLAASSRSRGSCLSYSSSGGGKTTRTTRRRLRRLKLVR